MKILFLTRRFYPDIGGVEKHVLEVAKRLVEMGDKVTVVTEGLRGQGGKEGQEGKEKGNETGIKIYRIPITRGERLKKFEIWNWLFNNKRLIEEADIIHCHDVFFWVLPFRILYPFKKIFTTFHGWEGIYPPSKKAIWVRKISEILSNGNICVGDYIKKWYGTKADYVTYGGVELVQSSKFKVQNCSSKFKILFIGRLEKDTGLPVYLDVLRKFKIYNLKFKILFAGDGSLRKEAEKFGQVVGWVDTCRETFEKEGIEKLIGDCDFVFTSGYLSILEAIAQEKFVFSVYDNPLKKDYLKQSPFAKYIFISHSPEKLAKTFKEVLEKENERKYRQILKSASAWAQQQTWDKVAKVYLDLWEKH